ncbi:GH22612 [Drosophila grimshawi]|uniref:GH22612 n=1 Tax=Drosophila grimshawi TaxID=7222 RepID=B4K2W8_DROGR|nr:GH22612 [Drosophila grimshawi]
MDRNHVLEKLANISSYNRCVRTVAYMLRFVQITHMKRKFETTLSSEELRNASYCIIWNIQQLSFVEDIRQLQKDQPLRSHLKFLNPLLDRSTGFSLIRVGGRLDNVEFENFEKHPILLPSKSHFVWIYVRHLHLRNCHAGPKAVVALIRLEYWIVNARDLARRIVRTCMACVRYKSKLERQLMGSLPVERLRPEHHIDFCGPINTYVRIRGRGPTKSYLAVFICLASKAVHIEVVSQLYTKAFWLHSNEWLLGERCPLTSIVIMELTSWVQQRS